MTTAAPSSQPANDTTIVKAGIYPPIGIARLGNSPAEFYLGPEVPNPLPQPSGLYRDATGAIKREAARFRIYGFNAAGQAVAELTSDNAEIEWAVTLANCKAAWYQFQMALDVPEAVSAPPAFLRNLAVADRSQLSILPGERRIKGTNQSGTAYAFDTGKFMGKPVYLGELRTDAQGRLCVLGGRGQSASVNGAQAITFANNEGWFDDISDGPVTATVHYQGKPLPVDPAWVSVAPPNYAPCQKSVRTMWDLMRDLFVAQGTLKAPAQPSFENDIRPIFERMADLQWVNAGYAAAFGWQGSTPFSQTEWMGKLASASANTQEWRQTLYNQFRQFERDGWAQSPWPWLFGDAMSVPALQIPQQNTALSSLQLQFLKQWAMGDFVQDYQPTPNPPRHIEDVPLQDQPDTLTRAAMEFCLADAFHPGCEMTWPMRQTTMYMAPFRLAHQPKGYIEPSFGGILMPSNFSGACKAQVPGGLTRWMAVPWQADTASCRGGYDVTYDPYLPTFWPAHVPNQVLSQRAYDTVMNEALPLDTRLSAFAKRAAWVRPLGNASSQAQINNMIQDFSQMGIVQTRPGPTDKAGSASFPQAMQVEQLPRKPATALLAEAGALVAELPDDFVDIDLSQTDKARNLSRHFHRKIA